VVEVVELISHRPAALVVPQRPLVLKEIVETLTLSALEALDDRDDIQPGDKVLLIIEDDVSFARIVRDAGRDKGFKVAIATLGELGLGLAKRLVPTAIVLDLLLPDIDGWVVLDQLKHDNATRHIPVEVISIDDQRHRGLKMGALGWLIKPTTSEALRVALDDLTRSATNPNKTLLLVEDNEVQRASVLALIGDHGVHTTAVGTGREALAALDERAYSCMVLDLGLPDMTGLELLRQIKTKPRHEALPIIIYTGKDLSKK
jgi:CheY-like chemotaxis protein